MESKSSRGSFCATAEVRYVVLYCIYNSKKSHHFSRSYMKMNLDSWLESCAVRAVETFVLRDLVHQLLEGKVGLDLLLEAAPGDHGRAVLEVDVLRGEGRREQEDLEVY